WLAARAEVTAGIDLSDGIAKDLPSLLPADCEADLDAVAIPLRPDAKLMATQSGRSALFHALCDGEDYELLGTVVEDSSTDALLRSWKQRVHIPVTRIGAGRMRPPGSKEPILRGLPSGLAEELHGYEHLS